MGWTWALWAALAWGQPSVSDIEAALAEVATDYDADRYDAGLARLDALLAELAEGPWTQHRVRALVFKGAILREQDRHEASRAVLTEALRRAEALEPGRSLSEALHNLALLEQRIGEEDAARVLLERAIEVHERLGVMDATLAQSLATLGSLYEVRGELDRAEIYYRRSLALQEAELPREHPDVALSWVRLGNIHWRRAEWAQARQAYAEAIARYSVSLGPDHPDVAVVLANLATVDKALGDLDAAREGLEHALAIHVAVLGDDDQLVATDLSNLGGLYTAMGEHAQAATYHRRALEIRLALFGEEHPKVAMTLNNLGMAYYRDGQVERAEQMLGKALGVVERIRGADSVDAGSIRLNRAMVHAALGRLGEARDGYAAGLEIIGGHLGPEHPNLAVGFNNLANLEISLGDVDRAVAHQERALAIQLARLGERHPQAVIGRSNLAMGLLRQDRLDEAEALHAEAVSLGAELSLTAEQEETLLEHTGWLHERQGRWKEALAARQELLERRTTSLPRDHPTLAATMQALASSLEALERDPVTIGALRERAWRLRHGVLGPSHPRTLQGLQVLVAGALRHGQVGPARRWLEVGLAEQELAAGVLAGLSARERRLYVRRLRPVMDLVLSLPPRAGDASWGLETVLRYQGSSLRTTLEQRRLGEEDPATQEILDALATLRRRLAQEVLRRPGDTAEASAREARLRSWSAEKDALERQVAAAAGSGAVPLDLAAICAELGPDEALVDQVRYGHVDASVPDGEARYIAFVLRGDDCDRVRRVELGVAERLEAAVAEARGAWQSGHASEQVRTGTHLRELLWDPMSDALAGVGRVWVVPDGSLATVPLPALPTEGGFLIEEVTLGMLSHAGELMARRPDAGARGMLLVGGVDHGGVQSTSRGVGHCLDRTFGALPGTREEIDGIAAIARRTTRGEAVTLLTGEGASEAQVRALSPGRRVLHLATHGFFSTEHCGAPDEGSGPDPRWVFDDNPLVRSGLVLAGANLDGGADDGLWTAEEVAGLDLSGTELVVLSACDTGLGAVEVGDGVLGLRRGLALAGAGAVVMSLWEVPDQDTSVLMRRLYREILARRRDPVEALRRAQLAALARARRQWGEPRPELWGAFVISGRAPGERPD